MRTRLQTLLPSVLVLTVISLLLVPVSALAAPAISMSPETARPGSTVEIRGTGYPANQLVEVELVTPEGTRHVATSGTNDDGDLREIVALPLDVSEGEWQLRATSTDGTSASFAFTTTAPVAAEIVETVTEADVPVEPAVVEAAADAAAAETRRGNSSGDIALMLIIAVVLGGLLFGSIVVYRQVKDETPPGMGKGDDLIWGGGTPEGPEQSATKEPYWKAAQPAATAQTET
jgi:hypothetical protein